MIGTPSLLLQLAFPLFFSVMGVLLLGHFWRKERTAKGALVVSLILIAAGFMWVRLEHNTRNRRSLQALKPEAVRRVRVGDHFLRKPEEVAAVVRALNRAEPFSPNHGGWGAAQWLILDLQEGGRLLFRVAPYQREKGAVVWFTRKEPGGYFRDTEVFSRDLPDTLAALNVSLTPTHTSAKNGQ